MTQEQIHQLVVEVIRRVAIRWGANGKRGSLVAVFTGATNDPGQAINQVRSLVLDGYRVKLVLSKHAEVHYGKLVRDQLDGFPHIDPVEESCWLTAAEESKAIIVPLLSMNTLSKVCMLIADNLPTRLILHSLFMGKPVFASGNSLYPHHGGRMGKTGVPVQSHELNQAVQKRIQTIKAFGCRLTDTHNLRNTVNNALGQDNSHAGDSPDNRRKKRRPVIRLQGKTLTAAQVRQARNANANLILPPGTLVTPLARDLAMTSRVHLLEGL